MIGLLRSEEYYDTPEQGSINNRLQRIGQLLWAPSLYLLDNHRRQAVKSSYTENSGEQFRLEPADLRAEFNQQGEISHSLGLRRDERALVIRAKKRPVIIISQPIATWIDGRRQQEDSYLVAPVYSFEGDETKLSYSQTFIDRVKDLHVLATVLPPAGWKEANQRGICATGQDPSQSTGNCWTKCPSG